MSKLLAPNGKPSNLTPEQYALVRTPQFKAWFGDWENNPESASKIVDENGEPLMVFHGTNQKFTIFSLDKVGSNVDYGMWGSGFYFSPIKSFSKSYGNNIMKVFLSIKNPFIKNPNLTGSSSQFKPVYGKEQSIQLRNDILDADFDGVIQYESGQKNLITQIIAFYPEQIKLADGSNTTFDVNNPDIRYSKGGNTQQGLEVKLVQDKDLSNELLDIAYVELGYVGQPRLALLENGKIIGGIFLEKPSSYIENGEYVVQPMWEYKFDIVIVKSKRNKGYSKILLDAMIQDFVSNFPDADQIRAEVTNKKLEKSLQKNYGFSCDSRNDEKITYCYLSKEDGEKYKNTADIKFENGGTTKKNMKKVDKGGITYGRSHAEGGIPVKNESTGQMLEMEGGEGIINKKAMASPQMVKIDGKEMTICEAASYLNQKDGNGRQFNCDDVEHQQFLTDHYGVGGELKKGIKKMNEGKMAKGGMTAQESLLKELNRLRRDLNSSRLSTYIEGDTSDEEMQRRRERESKMKRFNEVLETLRELDAKKYATGGTVMNSQDAENAIFDGTVFEHGGTVNAYDAGLHKKMYMLGIEVMQPDPIALARVMSDENDNFCEHYPKLCAGAEYQREELPQIYDKNYDEFVAYLENLGATVNFEGDTAVDSLKPVQNEISLERMARIMARVKDGYYKDLNLLKLPLFVSKDGYILDGHHRWATLFFLSPTNTIDIYRVNLTYKELVDKALNFDDAGTEKFMLGGMVNKQEQLDDASKITLRFAKGKVDCYYNFQNMQYSDLVRIEGSSQALLQGKFNPILWGYTSTGQFLNSYIYQQNIQAIRELQKTGGYDDWKIQSEYSAIQEKRSIAVDFYINKQKTSHGILELFDTSLPNYNMFIGELYCETVVQYIKEIMNLLSSDDWRKRGEGSLQSTAEYQLASYFYQINISKIYKIAQDSKNAEEAGQSYDVFNADTNFITVKEAEQLMNRMFTSPISKQPNTTAAAPTTQTGWNWRFKTEQEFIDEYGTNWIDSVKGGWITPEMDYLLGQPIEENSISKSDIIFLEINKDVKDIDTADWGIDSGKMNDFAISISMLTQKPLPTAAAPAPQPAWTWRFKTEKEFIDEYGTDWTTVNEDAEWNRESEEYDMDFLFGRRISQNPTSENVIDSLIEENYNYRVVNVDEYFWIVNPNPKGEKEFAIAKEFITDKPLPTAAAPAPQPTWNWRFKTEQELQQEWGLNRWKNKVAMPNSSGMDYLLGKPIIESDLSKQFIEDLLKSGQMPPSVVSVDTKHNLGIDSGSRNTWAISEELVTNKPLPTAAAPTTQTGWNWRFKTEQEFNKVYGNTWKKLLGWDLKGKMDYLFGQPLQEKPIVINNFIHNLFQGKTASTVNTEDAFGLVSPTGENMWDFKVQMFTQLPLPISAQPSPKTAKPNQRTATQKVEKEVYYSELMYDGVLGKNDKIVGARFLTEKEIKNYENKYGTSLLGLAVNTLRLNWDALSLSDAQQSYDDGGLEWTKDLLGQPLNPNLLPAVIEIFKFQKTINPTKAKEIFRTTYDSLLTDELRYSRLVIGQSTIGEYDFWKPIFPNVSEFDYLNANTFSETMSKFPIWYKNIVDERLKSMSVWNSKPLDPKSYSVGNDLYYPYYFFTGEINTKNKGEKDRQVPYACIPFTYLMLEIETEEQVLINITTNQSEIKKIKEEYAALQYYLNVEVPIDAFTQRKLITTVMEGVSDKLEKEIEALFYSPSFQPLFDFWAEKQTQGQRTIDLQPCMLPTPNGQKSELDLIQYEIVRSEEFKKWFGDWEEAAVTGNYNGVSRAINPLTKEPQVAFHGKANMALEFTKMAFATFPVKYFGTNLSYAEWFKENQSKSDRLTKLVYEFFLDIKNPIDLSPIGLTELTAEEFKELIKAQYNYDIQSQLHDEGTGKKNKLWVLIRFSPQMLEELKANTYFDGFIMYEDNSQDLTASGYDTNLLGFSPNSYELVQQVAGTPTGNFTLDFVTFTNFQIKAADGRNTTFFNNVEDFRFAKGGITKKRKK